MQSNTTTGSKDVMCHCCSEVIPAGMKRKSHEMTYKSKRARSGYSYKTIYFHPECFDVKSAEGKTYSAMAWTGEVFEETMDEYYKRNGFRKVDDKLRMD